MMYVDNSEFPVRIKQKKCAAHRCVCFGGSQIDHGNVRFNKEPERIGTQGGISYLPIGKKIYTTKDISHCLVSHEICSRKKIRRFDNHGFVSHEQLGKSV